MTKDQDSRAKGQIPSSKDKGPIPKGFSVNNPTPLRSGDYSQQSTINNLQSISHPLSAITTHCTPSKIQFRLLQVSLRPNHPLLGEVRRPQQTGRIGEDGALERDGAVTRVEQMGTHCFLQR